MCSLRVRPEVNESHIHELAKSNDLSIFHMGEVSEL